jgi:hypothetical protein
MAGTSPAMTSKRDPDPLTYVRFFVATRCAGGDASRRVGAAEMKELSQRDKKAIRRSDPQKAGRHMPVQIALRTGMFQCHCEEPTGPARSGRPDDSLRDEAIQVAWRLLRFARNDGPKIWIPAFAGMSGK